MTVPAPNDASHYYDPGFLSRADDAVLRAWLQMLYPLWENRRADHRPLRQGQRKRRLLRPVYWLGSWQFACLDYYRPPEGIRDRCMKAEPFPPRLAELVGEMEAIARKTFRGSDLPERWRLNSCLINFYGLRLEEGRWIDSARVRDHKDFEPGPVASLSLGERARMQFVENHYPAPPGAVVAEQWLEDGSLQIFGGPRWKDSLLHRVDLVERRRGHAFEFPSLTEFRTRRINFTFRYVPEEHVHSYWELSAQARRDVAGYVATLAAHSPFFASLLSE